VTENRMMSRMASQNGGTEMPAKAMRLMAWSTGLCGRVAA